MRKLSVLLSIVMIITALGSAVIFADTSIVTDELTVDVTEASGTGYAEWTYQSASSAAEYLGNSAAGKHSIQLKSADKISGIVTTVSGGYAAKVNIDWNSDTTDGKTLMVYGNDTQYDVVTDVYDSQSSGDLIGTIVKGSSTELIVEGDYEYIGLRSEDGAIYIDKITISWSPSPVSGKKIITFDGNGAEGIMTPDKEDMGSEYVLPDNGFIEPENMEFSNWKIGGKIYMPGDKITVNGDIIVVAEWREIEGSADALNREATGAQGTAYKDWSYKSRLSGAVYSGNSAGDKNSIQLRSKDNSGIISSTSGGYVTGIKIDWNSDTSDGRTLNIYGSNDPYSGTSDLYGDSSGNLIGTIVKGSSTELIVEGDYKYIGLRSASNAMYINKITVTWSPSPVSEKYTIEFDGNGAEGNMNPAKKNPGDEYILPSNGFIVPDGKAFDGWKIDSKKYMPGDKITVDGNMTVVAEWRASGGTDALNRAATGAQGTNYNNWQYISTISGAVYSGNSAGGNGSIQLRSSGNNYSGIVTTTSGGVAKKVSVIWNSGTTNGRTLDIYGKNTPYSAASDLYSSSESVRGTKLGSIVYGSGTSLTINGDYNYIGIRSSNGALYLSEVKITWGENGSTSSLAGYSVSLNGDIGVNFFMSLSDDILNDDDAYMLFTKPDGTTSKVYVKDIKDKPRTVSGNTYYVFSCGVSAKNMSGNVTAQMFVGGSSSGNPMIFSVKDYADYLLNPDNGHPDREAASGLIKAMLNYGTYAQVYFGVGGVPANDTDYMTPEEKQRPENEAVSCEAPVTDISLDNLPGVKYEGASLSLKNETTLSLYFKSKETLTFECSGRTVETVNSGSYQIARIRGIKADEIGTPITLTVSNGSEQGTVTYSALNYIDTILKGNYDSDLVNVVKALYFFYSEAVDYSG